MRTVSPERLRTKREKLEAALNELMEKERQQEERRYAIIGRALLSHAEHDEAFRAQLNDLLDRTVSVRRDRALLGLQNAARKRRETSTADA